MTRTQLSTSISVETRRKLTELVQHYGTQREAVTVAIDRLYQEHQAQQAQEFVASFPSPDN